MNGWVFQRLELAERERTGSAARAHQRALILYGFLVALATHDKAASDFPFSRSSYKRHMAALRRIGIAPVREGLALSALALDLGTTEQRQLARLMSALNADGLRNPERIFDRWANEVWAARTKILDESRRTQDALTAFVSEAQAADRCEDCDIVFAGADLAGCQDCEWEDQGALRCPDCFDAHWVAHHDSDRPRSREEPLFPDDPDEAESEAAA